MTEQTQPTDAEILDAADDFRSQYKHGGTTFDEFDALGFARAVLAKWGTPAGAGADLLRAAAIDLRDAPDLRAMQKATAKLYAALETTPQPTQAQAGAVPLTDIRKTALDLYTPPFRHEHGYIRDANNQMVADDAGSEGSGLIASRIRGWGRIQYMDKPEQRADALQDEVAVMVAEALNTYWAAHGIKGADHG